MHKNYFHTRYKKLRQSNILVSIITAMLFAIIAWSVAKSETQVVFFTLIAILMGYVLFRIFNRNNRPWKKVLQTPFPEDQKKILGEKVEFYGLLDKRQKYFFEKRVQYFLATKTITGVDTEIDILIKLLVAVSAIIPVFAFPDYIYKNISEILIYSKSFDREYQTKASKGTAQNIAGMVGTGAMSGMMILSKSDLVDSFEDRKDRHNVGIHEFVHLIDMKDGVTDGIPEILLKRSYVLPWISEIKREMKRIEKGRSDINPYALTNNAEFLAVVSEYFFEAPEKFKKEHPELYAYLMKIFRQRRVF